MGKCGKEPLWVNLRNKSYRIQADLSLNHPDARGVIFSLGSHWGGHALYIKDRRLHYVYNFLGIEEQHFISSESISIGDHSIVVEFQKTHEKPKFTSHGKLTLSIGKKKLIEGAMRTQPAHFLIRHEGLAVGRDTIDAVSAEYRPPFAFEGGTIQNVTFTPLR